MFVGVHAATERVNGNIEAADNANAALYQMLSALGKHDAIERLGLTPPAAKEPSNV